MQPHNSISSDFQKRITALGITILAISQTKSEAIRLTIINLTKKKETYAVD
jgi:hypothetical protein